MSLAVRRVAAGCCASLALVAACSRGTDVRETPGAEPTRVLVPAELQDAAWLDAQRERQRETTGRFTVFHDFQFAERVAESGITFTHRIVSDAGKTYKAVHYDHGNGIAVADVDGDGLHDIYFVSQVGGNGLWRNLGGGTFEDITASAGVAVADKVSVTASFADIDNDGDPDLYVTTVRGGNVLFENDGRGRFRDISRESGVDYAGHSSGAVFFDYDRDGRLDLFLANVGRYTTDETAGDGYTFYAGMSDGFTGHLHADRTEASILFHNEGGNRFVDVSDTVGLRDTSWSGDATPIDANGDGWLDLYVLSMQGNDEYYENDRGRRFVRKSRDVFPRTSWGAMSIKAFDFNNDGRLDIYITDMHSDMSETIPPERERLKSRMMFPASMVGDGTTSIWGNSFFLNEGPNRFREISDEIGAENYWPWGLSVGDLNADGFEDVFIASGMNYPFRYGINSVKLNNRGERFLDAEFILGVEPRADGLTTPWFELDASGADADHPDAKGQTGRVAVWAARGSRSAVIFDIDGDGDVDIVTNEFNARPMVLVSNLSERRPVRYLHVKLTGAASNRSGLGAIVRVRANGTTYTKAHDGKSGYLSQSLYPLYFGLGDAERIEEVEVTWPSGRRQRVAAPIEMNSLLEVKER